MKKLHGIVSKLQIRRREEWIVFAVLCMYLVFGMQTPSFIASLIDNVFGKIFAIALIFAAFLYANPIIALLLALSVYELFRRSGGSNLLSLQSYAPSEVKKASHFSAMNQFPYTLEQEMVAKMAPIAHTGNSLVPASYKPVLENIHDGP